MIWCVVPAAGRGARFSVAFPKQYAPLVGVPMLVRTLDRLLSHPRIAGAMVALSADDELWPSITELEGKPVRTCLGGTERADSVLAALDALAEYCAENDWVLVHDAARPCVRHPDIDALLEQGMQHTDGAILAAPIRDTVKRGSAGTPISETLDRSTLWRALTPQLFRYGELRAALRNTLANPDLRARITDEAAAFEATGRHPLLVQGDDDNIKVTTLHDLALAEFILTSPA
jgi:2-C-methyl-D-erythritol 4-phosphate cytidylyltransferase